MKEVDGARFKGSLETNNSILYAVSICRLL